MVRPLALTLGEPAGIGPDITVAAWRQRREYYLSLLASWVPLAALVLAVNLLGDWLRDALNPKLR